ncbi:MAG TPA: hypothetical protein VFI72_09930 [Candidatus Angelobacter sp.]|nr:hypothetical protein [Candidatus Angelobacter sp.]
MQLPINRIRFTLFFCVLTLSISGVPSAAQQRGPERPPLPITTGRPNYSVGAYSATNPMLAPQVRYSSASAPSYYAVAQEYPQLRTRDAASSSEPQPACRRQSEARAFASPEPQAKANPEAPDQSELLKNSKDRDFILRNFRTMYVDARDAQYFGADQMKAALGRNDGFHHLNIRMVDDPAVADVVLKVSYTFAWEYPFELRHQNTTIVLLAGKGLGPFSGPLGAADVARQFVNAAKPYRVAQKGK